MSLLLKCINEMDPEKKKKNSHALHYYLLKLKRLKGRFGRACSDVHHTFEAVAAQWIKRNGPWYSFSIFKAQKDNFAPISTSCKYSIYKFWPKRLLKRSDASSSAAGKDPSSSHLSVVDLELESKNKNIKNQNVKLMPVSIDANEKNTSAK